MIYVKEGDKLCALNHCVVSSSKDHDVPFVYETPKLACNYLKEDYASVKRLHYFTDG